MLCGYAGRCFFAVSEKGKRFNDFEEIHVKFEDNLANGDI